MAGGQNSNKKHQLRASRAIQGVEWLESVGEGQERQRGAGDAPTSSRRVHPRAGDHAAKFSSHCA